MSRETEWFQGDTADRKPRLILPVAIWALALAAMIGGALLLAGCSTPTTFDGICAFKPMGMTDGGIAVARVRCEVAS